MKDNLEAKNICNRKIIIELRFLAKASILDKKGIIADALHDAKIFVENHWEIGNDLQFTDNTSQDKDEWCNMIWLSHNRLSFISNKISSIEEYFSKFEKIREIIEKETGKLSITRIGCRIIGSYKTKSSCFPDVVKGFLSQFPGNYLLDKYKPKDSLFVLEYENGRYQIGPLSEKDGFFQKEFPSSRAIKHTGVCIDTDNYITNEVKPIDDKHLVKDVYSLSLAVEKDLYSHLAEL